MNNTPLSIMIEEARNRTLMSVNQILRDTCLPAYLYEGILLGVLSEIRERKNMEILSDAKQMKDNDENKDGGDLDGEH